jgi:hypothetical protein
MAVPSAKSEPFRGLRRAPPVLAAVGRAVLRTSTGFDVCERDIVWRMLTGALAAADPPRGGACVLEAGESLQFTGETWLDGSNHGVGAPGRRSSTLERGAATRRDVLEGVLGFEPPAEGNRVEAGETDGVHLPAAVPHRPSNAAVSPVRVLFQPVPGAGG